jgi:predicted ferric reductase
MRVDGPYGNQKLNYRRFPNLLLVAGGIGITPVLVGAAPRRPAAGA